MAGAVVELVVEVDGGVDQRQVGERLGEVTELLPGEPDLLGAAIGTALAGSILIAA